MTHGELTQGVARGSHILLGKHEITRTNRSTPITGSYPVQANRVGSLGPTVEPHPEQRLRNQRSTAC